jgi:hypothetical protein
MPSQGYDDAVFNMLQVSNMSVNARFTFANFTLAPNDPRRATVREVHGSHLTAAYVLAQTVVDGRHAVVVKAEFDAARPFVARVQVVAPGGDSGAPIVDTWIGADDGPVHVGPLELRMRKAQASSPSVRLPLLHPCTSPTPTRTPARAAAVRALAAH